MREKPKNQSKKACHTLIVTLSLDWFNANSGQSMCIFDDFGGNLTVTRKNQSN